MVIFEKYNEKILNRPAFDDDIDNDENDEIDEMTENLAKNFRDAQKQLSTIRSKPFKSKGNLLKMLKWICEWTLMAILLFFKGKHIDFAVRLTLNFTILQCFKMFDIPMTYEYEIVDISKAFI